MKTIKSIFYILLISYSFNAYSQSSNIADNIEFYGCVGYLKGGTVMSGQTYDTFNFGSKNGVHLGADAAVSLHEYYGLGLNVDLNFTQTTKAYNENYLNHIKTYQPSLQADQVNSLTYGLFNIGVYAYGQLPIQGIIRIRPVVGIGYTGGDLVEMETKSNNEIVYTEKFGAFQGISFRYGLDLAVTILGHDILFAYSSNGVVGDSNHEFITQNNATTTTKNLWRGFGYQEFKIGIGLHSFAN